MDELTQRLSTDQAVVVGGSRPSLGDLRRRVEEVGYVFIKFTQTHGGTDLGFNLDHAASDVTGADFDEGSGMVHIEGALTLNDDPVRCVADIDLATLAGTGRLVLAEISS